MKVLRWYWKCLAAVTGFWLSHLLFSSSHFQLGSKIRCEQICWLCCDIPEDEDLAQLVSKVQKHWHSTTCRKNGRGCRFHYTRAPSLITLIACEVNPDTCFAEEVGDTKTALFEVRKTLDDSDTPNNITLEELLVKAAVTYLQGLNICSKGTSIVMKRAPGDSWIQPCDCQSMEGKYGHSVLGRHAVSMSIVQQSLHHCRRTIKSVLLNILAMLLWLVRCP